jgi:hypothetical protein
MVTAQRHKQQTLDYWLEPPSRQRGHQIEFCNNYLFSAEFNVAFALARILESGTDELKRPSLLL